MKSRFTLLTATLMLWVSGYVNAAPNNIKQVTKFNINYAGIYVGNATFTITTHDNDYQLDIQGSTAGIARLFSHGKGSLQSKGKIEDEKITSQSNFVEVVAKGKTARLDMEFDQGNLKSVAINPTKKPKKGKDYIPVLDKHLKSILDPASGLIVPLKNDHPTGPQVCNRTLNVYDGETRFDIRLKYKSTRLISTKGYKGKAFACALRYVPIAGHRKGHRSVEFMRKNKKMEVWLAPIKGTRLYTVIKIDVGSQIGRFIAWPQQFMVTALSN